MSASLLTKNSGQLRDLTDYGDIPAVTHAQMIARARVPPSHEDVLVSDDGIHRHGVCLVLWKCPAGEGLNRAIEPE